MEALAAQLEVGVAAKLRNTRTASVLREDWRWKLAPEGEEEQLVLFNYGPRGGGEVTGKSGQRYRSQHMERA